MAERPGLHVVKMEYVYRSIECAHHWLTSGTAAMALITLLRKNEKATTALSSSAGLISCSSCSSSFCACV